jgi:murein DD-endopeptidase MepM/ murein hydrolase activator NlpD
MKNTLAVVAAALLIASEVLAQAPATDRRQPASVKPKAGHPTPSTQAITIDAAPGTVVRWSVPGTKRCAMGKRTWDALKETCYYPLDLEQKPAVVHISRHGAGAAEYARLNMLPPISAREDIVLGDIPQAHPSPAELRRNAREQIPVAKLWTKHEGPARFTLPLAAPGKAFPEGHGFGSTWVFNSPPGTSELHSGADYAMAAGTPITAVADGTVVIAADLFFAGNAVFIDHGDGLISMYFHLRDLTVKAGQNVKQGQSIGVVGSTGRVTGPHLHLGMRWHGARIDPALLFGDPAKIPTVGP